MKNEQNKSKYDYYVEHISKENDNSFDEQVNRLALITTTLKVFWLLTVVSAIYFLISKL